MDLAVLKYVGAGLMAMGMCGAAIGIGLIFSGAVQGIARNPSLAAKITTTAFIGAALAELMGLLSFLGVILLFFVL